MVKVDYLIIYELVQRELENVLLIGLELENRGYLVEYAQYPFKDISALRRRYFNNVNMVLTQSMYNEKTLFNLVYNIAGKVDKVLNLQWEQVGTISSENDIGNYRYPKGLAKKACHICWGEVPQHNLIRAGISKERTFITGPVHMDFLRAKFNSYYKSRREIFPEFMLDDRMETVLFISSFSYANLSDSAIRNLSSKVGKETVDTFRKISVDSQSALLGWIKRILEEYEAINFIYRPHPAERVNRRIMDLQKEYKKFKVIGDYSVKQWIKVSDKIYTWYSTAIVEAVFDGKNCAIVRPIEIPEEREVSIMVGTKKITDFSAFKDSIAFGLKELIDTNRIKSYYDFNTYEESYIRLCDVAEKIFENDNYNLLYNKEVEKKFSKMLLKEKIMTVLVLRYFFLLDILSSIQYRFKHQLFGANINRRINNYRKAKQSKENKINSTQYFAEVKRNLRGILYE